MKLRQKESTEKVKKLETINTRSYVHILMIVVMVDVIRMQIQVYYWLPYWLVVLYSLGYGLGG